MTEWVEVLHGDTLTCIAMVQGFELKVVGGDGLWVWFIDLNGRHIIMQKAGDLPGAKLAAETTAYWLAYEQQGDPEPGSA